MKRLTSLDAVRGFDMLFIMGGEWLVAAMAAALGYHEFEASFGHVPWHGLQFMDTVFPTFLFLAGASFPFSLAKSRERGLSDGRVARKCLVRGLVLFALGLVYNGFLLKLDFASFRIWSVLGRIGLGWMFAAWIYLLVRRWKTRALLAVGLFFLTFVAFNFLSAPGMPAGGDIFSAEWNFGCWLDRTLTGGHTYRPDFDPEGFAGIPGAILTAMLGMFIGDLVRRGEGPSAKNAGAMALSGLVFAAVGLVGANWCPINKSLWTPTFAMTVAGYSTLLLALFYWIIDVKGCVRWAFFFTVIGMNSIAIYLGQSLIDFKHAEWFVLGGFISLFPDGWGSVAGALGYIGICWLFLWFLYKKNIFLKV